MVVLSPHHLNDLWVQPAGHTANGLRKIQPQQQLNNQNVKIVHFQRQTTTVLQHIHTTQHKQTKTEHTGESSKHNKTKERQKHAIFVQEEFPEVFRTKVNANIE